ncbi:MAG: trimethylamine methyltransferase family protein [Chloroflexia bacterium]
MKPTFFVLSDREVWNIHCASLDVLENVGVAVHQERAREILLEAGAVPSGGTRVRLPARLVKGALERCAPVVLLYGREGQPPLRVGGDRVYFGTCGYPSNVVDWHTGEIRAPRLSDLEETARLTDVLDNIDFIMPPLSPDDVPVELVDRYQWMATLLNTRKHVLNQCYGETGFRDLVAIASEIAGGLEALQREPFVSLLVSTTSPLTLRVDASEVIIGGAELGLPLFIFAGPMAGATAPCSLAASLTLANAEVLAAIVLAKAVNESVPVIYASWARTLDMKYGNVTLGAPEFAMLRTAATQMAHLYGLPCGGGGLLTDAKVPDAQAGYEKLGTALLPALAGMNMICGAAAYGAEVVLSLEGYIIDDEVAGWVKRVLSGFAVDEERLALSLIAAQGPGGQFVKEEHTLRFFRQEMWIPTLSDREGTTGWLERGAQEIRARARRLIEKKLQQYRPLDLPAGTRERVAAIIEQSAAGQR